MVMEILKSHANQEANAVLLELDKLCVGESVKFTPPLAKPIVDALYALLRNVDKGWIIYPPEDKRSWWKKMFDNYPVDMRGRPIPQTIAEIKRKR